MSFQTTADALAAALQTQITTLQTDLATAGGADAATVDQLAQLVLDARAAGATAGSLAEAHDGVLAGLSGAFVAGTPTAVTSQNVALLINATMGSALAFDTANRLARLTDNLQAI